MSSIIHFEPGYLKTSVDFPFLKPLEANLEVVRKAYDFILQNELLQPMPGLVERQSVQADSWYLFPVYINCNYDFYLDFLSYKVGVDVREVFQQLRSNLPELFALLDGVIASQRVVSITFMRMKPGTTLRLHSDSGDYQYRSHMGIHVPKGNVGLRVKDSVAKWKEGRFMVFDAVEPHAAWNLADEDRVVLSIDLFKEPLEESRASHIADIHRKMETSPLGFEGGGYFSLDEDTINQFNRIVELVEY